MDENLDALLEHRTKLLGDIAQSGDMRQGSISENYRKCGKAGCRCAEPDHPGHGPYYAWTRKVDKKTKTVNLRPGRQLDKLQREVETYKQFRESCRELVEINEKICEARPLEEPAAETATVKKKLSRLSKPRSTAK